MKITLEFPDHLPDLLQETKSEFEKEIRMSLAIKMFERKRLSSGLAANLVGLNRVDFLLQLHEYGIPMIDMEADELLQDLGNA